MFTSMRARRALGALMVSALAAAMSLSSEGARAARPALTLLSGPVDVAYGYEQLIAGAGDPKSGTVWAITREIDSPWTDATTLRPLVSAYSSGVPTSVGTAGSVVFDSSGRAYVGECPWSFDSYDGQGPVNHGTQGIEVFQASASSATRLRAIAGSKTGLAPVGQTCQLRGNNAIAVSSDGTIYAAVGSKVLVFGPTANGNVAPARSFTAVPAGQTISAIARDSGGLLYVRTDSSVRVFADTVTGTPVPAKVLLAGNLSGRAPFLPHDNFGNVYDLRATAVNVYAPPVLDGQFAMASYSVGTALEQCDPEGDGYVYSMLTVARNRKLTISCPGSIYGGALATYGAVVAPQPVSLSLSSVVAPTAAKAGSLLATSAVTAAGGYFSGKLYVTLTSPGQTARTSTVAVAEGSAPFSTSTAVPLPALPNGTWTASVKYSGNSDFAITTKSVTLSVR